MTFTSGRKTYHHGDLRRTLIAEARALLADGGAAGVTLRAVGSRAGVSPAASYRHFADKQALLAAVAAEGFDDLTRRAAVIRADGPPGIATLHRMTCVYIEFAVAEPALYRLMRGPQLFDRARHPELAEAEDRLRQQAEGALYDARAAGEIADLPIHDVATTIHLMMHGIAVTAGERQVADAAALSERVMAVLDAGLRPR
ncbi:TetR/AcrR family transcriptional regulator [Mycobacterium sp. NPDC003449]